MRPAAAVLAALPGILFASSGLSAQRPEPDSTWWVNVRATNKIH